MERGGGAKPRCDDGILQINGGVVLSVRQWNHPKWEGVLFVIKLFQCLASVLKVV